MPSKNSKGKKNKYVNQIMRSTLIRHTEEDSVYHRNIEEVATHSTNQKGLRRRKVRRNDFCPKMLSLLMPEIPASFTKVCTAAWQGF